MHVEIARTDLVRILSAVGRIVESRNTIPILSNVMIAAGDGEVVVTGTDLEIMAYAKAQAECTSGSICVPASTISDIAKKAGSDTITMDLVDGNLIVKSGRSKFTIPTLPSTDFPIMSNVSYAGVTKIDLVSLFQLVSFAISNEETRYYLNGIFVQADGNKITATATDGHRLASYSVDSDAVFPSVIIPTKTVQMCPKGEIEFSVSENGIQYVAGDLTIMSRVIDGTFPDYNRVIPSNNESVATFNRDEMIKASDRVVTISMGDKTRAVKLAIAPGAISLSAKKEGSNASDEIEADFSGEPLDVGINASYLSAMLSVLPNGRTEFHLGSQGSPVLVKSPTLPTWTGVVMPMRI